MKYSNLEWTIGELINLIESQKSTSVLLTNETLFGPQRIRNC